jgi:hypothetical protein
MGGTWRSPHLGLCFFTTNSEHPPAAVRRTTAQDEHLTHRRLCPAPTTSALVARTPCCPRPRIHLWLITSRPNWMLRATWRSPCLDLLCFFTTNSEHPPAAVHRATTQDEHLTCHAWHFSSRRTSEHPEHTSRQVRLTSAMRLLRHHLPQHLDHPGPLYLLLHATTSERTTTHRTS